MMGRQGYGLDSPRISRARLRGEIAVAVSAGRGMIETRNLKATGLEMLARCGPASYRTIPERIPPGQVKW
jgi:hypothetical protein